MFDQAALDLLRSYDEERNSLKTKRRFAMLKEGEFEINFQVLIIVITAMVEHFINNVITTLEVFITWKLYAKAHTFNVFM